jgi:cell division cycle protein 20 (cofactor of APC complex)
MMVVWNYYFTSSYSILILYHWLTGMIHFFSLMLTVRARNNVTCRLQAHSQEVCGLKWSETGNLLASGGNENLLYIWESSKMNSSKFLYRFKDHCAAVKALAWCPYQSGILASGGGTEDGCIKLWNTQKGTCINTIDTNSQASYRI